MNKLLIGLLATLTSVSASAVEISGFYSNSSTYETDAKYSPTDIPKDYVDEVLYGPTQIGSCNTNQLATETNPSQCHKQFSKDGKQLIQSGEQNYKLTSTDPLSDYAIANINGTKLKGHANIAKALDTDKPIVLQIAGPAFSAAMKEAITQEHFIQSIIDFMKTAEQDAADNYGVKNKHFVGVNVNWQPNNNMWTLTTKNSENVALNVSDLHNYQIFLQQLRKALTKAGYADLSVNIPANTAVLADVDKVYQSKYGVGFWQTIINKNRAIARILTSEYYIPGEHTRCLYSQFSSPLYADNKNICPTNRASISNSVSEIVKLGISPNNIIIIVPTFGRAYPITTLTQIDANNPYAKVNTANQDGVTNIAVKSYGNKWTIRQLFTGRAFGKDTKSEATEWNFWFDDYQQVTQSYASSHVGGNVSNPAIIYFTDFQDGHDLSKWALKNHIHGLQISDLSEDIQPGDKFTNGQTIPWNITSLLSGLASTK